MAFRCIFKKNGLFNKLFSIVNPSNLAVNRTELNLIHVVSVSPEILVLSFLTLFNKKYNNTVFWSTNCSNFSPEY